MANRKKCIQPRNTPQVRYSRK